MAISLYTLIGKITNKLLYDKKIWRLETGIFVGTWLLLMVFARSSLLRDPGTFTHTVVGERILSNGQLIYADPFSFTYSGKHWIAHQWLWECIMAFIHQVAGFDSLLLATWLYLGWTNDRRSHLCFYFDAEIF